MHFLKPFRIIGMVLCLIATTLSIETFYYGNNNNNNMQQTRFVRQQLFIYDPFSGRQMLPFHYLPRAFSSNPNNNNNKNNMYTVAKPNTVTGNLVELPKLWNPCSCSDYSCMCCIGFGFGSTNRDRVCVSLAYNAAQVALQLRIDHNQYTIANMGFSVQNPPDYCVPLLLPLPIFSCLRLYDVRIIPNGNVQVCSSIVLKVFTNQIYEYHFDCVRFGGQGVYFVKSTPHDAEDESAEQEDVLLSGNVLQYGGSTYKQQQQANDKINADDFRTL